MTNTQRMYNATRALVGQTVSARMIRATTQQMYPGTPDGSLLVSDHSRVRDSNGNLVRKGTQSATYADGLFEATAMGYKVLADSEIQRKSGMGATRGQWSGPSPSAAVRASAAPGEFASRRIDRTRDRAGLVAALRLLPPVRKSSDRAWVREPAVRVIDCVLSLMRRYDAFVVPRLDGFERRHPEVRTVSELQRLIAGYRSPRSVRHGGPGLSARGARGNPRRRSQLVGDDQRRRIPRRAAIKPSTLGVRRPCIGPHGTGDSRIWRWGISVPPDALRCEYNEAGCAHLPIRGLMCRTPGLRCRGPAAPRRCCS
jgi:hypothetical protein